jgi:hypothetical protein
MATQWIVRTACVLTAAMLTLHTCSCTVIGATAGALKDHGATRAIEPWRTPEDYIGTPIVVTLRDSTNAAGRFWGMLHASDREYATRYSRDVSSDSVNVPRWNDTVTVELRDADSVTGLWNGIDISVDHGQAISWCVVHEHGAGRIVKTQFTRLVSAGGPPLWGGELHKPRPIATSPPE